MNKMMADLLQFAEFYSLIVPELYHQSVQLCHRDEIVSIGQKNIKVVSFIFFLIFLRLILIAFISDLNNKIIIICLHQNLFKSAVSLLFRKEK